VYIAIRFWMTSFPSPLSKNENISLQNISEIVRTKQQELNNVHDMHIQQLEKVPNQISTYLSSFISLSLPPSLYHFSKGIDERNKLLADASRKFNLLRDDFQYNLTLLEARDLEINRLGQVELNLLHEIETKNNEMKILNQKFEKIQKKETENYQKYQTERSQTKKFLLELQEEAESLRWSTNEEMSQKQKEIETLKRDLYRERLERKDALEMQRIELIKTYESLLQTKDEDFVLKENEISQQVVLILIL
jgi:hypothetical protein